MRALCSGNTQNILASALERQIQRKFQAKKRREDFYQHLHTIPGILWSGADVNLSSGGAPEERVTRPRNFTQSG